MNTKKTDTTSLNKSNIEILLVFEKKFEMLG